MNFLFSFPVGKTITDGDELRHVKSLFTHEHIKNAMKNDTAIMSGWGETREEARIDYVMKLRKLQKKTGDQLSDH